MHLLTCAFIYVILTAMGHAHTSKLHQTIDHLKQQQHSQADREGSLSPDIQVVKTEMKSCESEPGQPKFKVSTSAAIEVSDIKQSSIQQQPRVIETTHVKTFGEANNTDTSSASDAANTTVSCSGRSCDMSCRDLSLTLAQCDVDEHPECVCREGMYLGDLYPPGTLQLIPCRRPGCTHNAGESAMVGCGVCICQNGLLDCNNTTCEDLRCVNGQKLDTLKEGDCKPVCPAPGISDQCRPMPVVNGVVTEMLGCYCPSDTTEDPMGHCVPLSECPCYAEGEWMAHGDVVLAICFQRECNNSIWFSTEANC